MDMTASMARHPVTWERAPVEAMKIAEGVEGRYEADLERLHKGES
jgi:hypothetical protein